jgi:membrane associated rhomboid family serine protease
VIIVPVEKKVDWKRPPVVLILIVLVNVLVFAFYQSGDQELLAKAVQTYQNLGLQKKEWSAYKAYSRRNSLPFKIEKSNPDMPWYMVPDSGFDRFMEKNHRHYIAEQDYTTWRIDRDRVEALSSRISSKAYGFDSSNIGALQLITHQFLHGGVMHILGNMVFLILTGFAVEAALGGWRFLGFYLFSGIGGALLFSQFGGSGGSLVGASGSISGVMAMYVVLFGHRKIQFFYWFFIFTGYVRAAAIIMLPFYLGFEVYKYLSDDGSNVAYTAHIGGFLVGSALVFLTQNLNKTGIDKAYIESEEEPPDPFAQSLNKLYLVIAQCDFNRAWEMLKPLKKANPSRSVLIEIEYNLVKAVHPKKLNEYLLHRIGKPANSKALVLAQIAAWSGYNDKERSSISFEKKAVLLESFLDVDSLSAAENIFKDIKSISGREMDVAILARRIAVFCQSIDHAAKTDEYNALARNIVHTTASSAVAIQ